MENNTGLVFSMEAFSPIEQKKQELEALASEANALDILDIHSKEQIKTANAKRKELQDARIFITKTAKEMRDGANSFSKKCIEIEKELCGIITEPESRLKKLLEETDEAIEKEKRLKFLEENRVLLNDCVPVDEVLGFRLTDEQILAMDLKNIKDFAIQRMKVFGDAKRLFAEKLQFLSSQEEKIEDETLIDFLEIEAKISDFAISYGLKPEYEKAKLDQNERILKEQEAERISQGMKAREEENARKIAELEEAARLQKIEAENAKLETFFQKIENLKTIEEVEEFIENLECDENLKSRIIAKAIDKKIFLKRIEDEKIAAVEAERARVISENIIKEQQEEARLLKEKEEAEKTAKNKKYLVWLEENGYNEAEGDFVKRDGNTFSMYKKASVITL